MQFYGLVLDIAKNEKLTVSTMQTFFCFHYCTSIEYTLSVQRRAFYIKFVTAI